MEDVQKQLEKSIIPVSELNGKIKIEITGELQVVKFEIDPSLLTSDQKSAVEQAVKSGFTKAIKQAKDLATNKLQSVTGGLFSGAMLLHDTRHVGLKSQFPLDELIQYFSIFKGIGQKTAQRLALEAIMLSEDKIQSFATSLVNTKKTLNFAQLFLFVLG